MATTKARSPKALDAYEKKHLRYSQLAPITMFEERNTKTNLPAQIEIYADGEHAYTFLFIAKGGGSANKTFLFQGTPSLLTHDRMIDFLKEKILALGTAACPPYHLAIVIGGTSAELNLKTVKLASTRYLDHLPRTGSEDAHAFRDVHLEEEIFEMTQNLGVGAQFGGKYFCHDVRVVRLPRHGASLPIAIGVSCSADRQALAKITREGVFLEELEHDPARYLPAIEEAALGTGVVPAKTPAGFASGSFGPTTAGRMDSYVDQFQALGGSLVMIAKGNRLRQVREACAKHGGFYLGSIGGGAARLAQDCIKKVEALEYPELGMEAIWRIEVANFPAFIVIDDKGNDLFTELNLG
jgi:tartrate/fumarate subfamily iron-sulfur-dependent hydro-lyase beta chain